MTDPNPPADEPAAPEPNPVAIEEPAAAEPAPATTPTGQPTLDALIAFLAGIVQDANAALPVLEGVAKATWAGITEAISALEPALLQVREVLDPAAGREVERETELAQMFAAKDAAGLISFYQDKPAHPNKSRAICANYLRLLGYTVNDDGTVTKAKSA